MYVNVSKSEWNQPLLPWSITCIAETVYIVGIAVEINGKLILTISKVSELIQVPSASSCPTLNSENHFGWNSYVRKVFLDQGFSQHTIDSSRLVPWKRSWIFFEKNWSHCRVCCQRYDSFTAISPVVFMGWFNYILVLQSAGGWLIYFQSIDQWLLRKFDPAPVTGYRLQVFLYVPVERCRILAHIILPLSFSVEQHLAKTPLPTCLVFVWLKHQLLMSETVRFWKKRVSLCPDLD